MGGRGARWRATAEEHGRSGRRGSTAEGHWQRRTPLSSVAAASASARSSAPCLSGFLWNRLISFSSAETWMRNAAATPRRAAPVTVRYPSLQPIAKAAADAAACQQPKQRQRHHLFGVRGAHLRHRLRRLLPQRHRLDLHARPIDHSTSAQIEHLTGTGTEATRVRAREATRGEALRVMMELRR